VRGNMDNAEPIFVVGGIGERKTHYFENVIHIEANKLKIEEDLKAKLKEGYKSALLRGYNFENEKEIEAELNAGSIEEFFASLSKEVDEYYESIEN
jgi:devr family CRISPR-associated regulatory protein